MADRECARFVIYIINEIANEKQKTSSQVYEILKSTNCIDEYLTPFYDVLHTMSSQNVVRDVFEFVKGRGGEL